MRPQAKPARVEQLVVEERKRQAEMDLRHVLGSPEGRRFYWRLLQRANLFGASYTDSAARTAYLEGRRSLAIEVMAEVQAVAPADHILTLQEQFEVQQGEASRRRLTEAQGEVESAD